MQTDINTARLGCDEREAAALLGLSVHTLRKDRVTAQRFPFYKIGSSVRYNRERLAQALAEMERGGLQKPVGRAAR